jgi:acetyl-CoA carboxylase biotin carboxyl carrier protein
MNIANIKKLVKLVESSQIHELEIQEEGLQVRIVKSGATAQAAVSPQIIHAVPPSAHPEPHFSTQIQEAKVETVASNTNENVVEIISPMVGTFYRAPSPDASPYVKEGDAIKPGQILCIVEAMKLMNEIEAEISGKIVKILIENGQPVEYNQPLFLIEKV